MDWSIQASCFPFLCVPGSTPGSALLFLVDSAHSSRSSFYIRRGHVKQSGQVCSRRTVNLDVHTWSSGHGLTTRLEENNNLRQVKHVNSFLSPCLSRSSCCFSGRENHKKVYTDQWLWMQIQHKCSGWSENSSRTYWVSSRVTAQSAEPVLLLQHWLLSFSLPVMLYWLCVLANISLITPLLLLSPALSLAGCLYLSSHPPWCFFPLPTINVAFKMPIDLFP